MRLFVAINFSEKTRASLFAAANRLCAQGQGIVSPAENLHLTLAFLGETDRLDAAVSALMQVNAAAFSLRFGNIGCFDDLYWVGIAQNASLSSLQTQLSAHLREAGFHLQEREFLPHVTLVRRFAPRRDFSSLPVDQILAGIEEPVCEIALMASYPRGVRMRYETLAVRQLNEI